MDEVLSPRDCSRCGHCLLPPHDAWVFCPACGLCLARHPFEWNPTSSVALVRAWLAVHGCGVMHTWEFFHCDPLGQPMSVGHAQLGEWQGYSALLIRGYYPMDTETFETRQGVVLEVAAIGGPTAGSTDDGANAVVEQIRGALPPGSECARSPWGYTVSVPPATVDGGELPRVLETVIGALSRSGHSPIAWLAPPRCTSRVELARSVMPTDGGPRSVECRGCGAPIAVSVLAACSADATCPHCDAPVQIDPALAHELRSYRHQLSAHQRGDIASPLEAAIDKWNRWGAQSDSGERAAPSIALTCAGCGAPCAHDAGAIGRQCGHCGAPVIPNQVQMHAMVRGVRERWTARAGARHAKMRFLVTAHSSAQDLLVPILFISLAVFAAPTLMVVVLMLVKEEGVWVLFPAGGAALLLALAGGLAFRAMSRTRGRRREVAACQWESMSEELGGVELIAADANEWCRTRWPYPVDLEMARTPTAAFGAIRVVADGVDTLVWGDLGVLLSGCPWIRVYVALRWTDGAGLLLDSPAVQRQRTALAAAGFSTRVLHHGLELVASDEVVRGARSHEGAMADVTAAVREAWRLVELLGGPAAPRAPSRTSTRARRRVRACLANAQSRWR